MRDLPHHENILDRLIDSWRKHRRMQQQQAFLRNSYAFDVERMAADVGMGVDELAEIIGRGDDVATLSARMMAAHGFDRDTLAAHDRASLREISVTCSRCDHAHRCEVELDAGTAARHAEAFCPNAPLMLLLADEIGTPGARPA